MNSNLARLEREAFASEGELLAGVFLVAHFDHRLSALNSFELIPGELESSKAICRTECAVAESNLEELSIDLTSSVASREFSKGERDAPEVFANVLTERRTL